MPAENHNARVCAKCGGQLQSGADVCPWCHAPATGGNSPQRIRVRKKRSILGTYFEHVRRHWIYFFLAILAGIAAAWLLLDFAHRPPRPAAPASLTVPRLLS